MSINNRAEILFKKAFSPYFIYHIRENIIFSSQDTPYPQAAPLRHTQDDNSYLEKSFLTEYPDRFKTTFFHKTESLKGYRLFLPAKYENVPYKYLLYIQ